MHVPSFVRQLGYCVLRTKNGGRSRPRIMSIAVWVFIAAMLTACARTPVAHGLNLSVQAMRMVNPDELGRPAPVVVRLYELKDRTAFDTADFFTLQDNDTNVLGNTLIKRDEWLLLPGERRELRRNLDPATRVIAVTAAYRDLAHAIWRAAYPVASMQTLTVEVNANAVRILPAKEQGRSRHTGAVTKGGL